MTPAFFASLLTDAGIKNKMEPAQVATVAVQGTQDTKIQWRTVHPERMKPCPLYIKMAGSKMEGHVLSKMSQPQKDKHGTVLLTVEAKR